MFFFCDGAGGGSCYTYFCRIQISHILNFVKYCHRRHPDIYTHLDITFIINDILVCVILKILNLQEILAFSRETFSFETDYILLIDLKQLLKK